MPATGFADIWTARCQNMQFSFDRTAKRATLYFQGAKGLFAVSTGPVVFDNGTAVRAQLSAGGFAETDSSAQLGLNKSREIVYLVSREPGNGKPKDTIFCETSIQVSP